MFSGGIGSWSAARRVKERKYVEDMTLLFADTLIEHPDTYRFLNEAAADIGCEFVRIADGRTPWQVFRDVKFLGNSQADPCSRILKRDLLDKWIAANCDVDSTTVYIGIDWTEEHRYTRLRERKLPWKYEAPLCDPPYITKADAHDMASAAGIRKQTLYELGAPHANCGGACIKMGHGGFARLLKYAPDTYAEWERNEAELRNQLGDVAILRDRSGGDTRPITLSDFRARLEAGGQVDMFDIGGCGCAID